MTDDALTADQLLDRFHEQIRLQQREDEPQPGIVQDADGPVLRRYPQEPGTSYCMVESPRGLGGDPDRWIERQVAFFAARGEPFEWKTYGYDEPADLGERLGRAGLVAEDEEVLLLGEASRLVHDVRLPATVRLRAVSAEDTGDFERIGALMREVWGADGSSGAMTSTLRDELRASPSALDVVVAEEDPGGPVLCAAWLRFSEGTDFASLWGGSTHPAWRHRGLYRATVAHRARLAAARGFRHVRVDTSPDSRPVLTRLGLVAAATTTPYVFTPAG